MEAQALHTNTTTVITKFLYEHILTRFGCPLIIVTNQGTHFINNAFKYLTDHFILGHISSTLYYLQGNEQAESTNKVFGNLSNQIG